MFNRNTETYPVLNNLYVVVSTPKFHHPCTALCQTTLKKSFASLCLRVALAPFVYYSKEIDAVKGAVRSDSIVVNVTRLCKFHVPFDKVFKIMLQLSILQSQTLGSYNDNVGK
jgi:hypothetical protein